MLMAWLAWLYCMAFGFVFSFVAVCKAVYGDYVGAIIIFALVAYVCVPCVRTPPWKLRRR